MRCRGREPVARATGLYLLRIQFAPSELPGRCQQFQTTRLDQPRTEQEIHLTDAHFALLAAQNPRRGVAGIHWEWDQRRRPGQIGRRRTSANTPLTSAPFWQNPPHQAEPPWGKCAMHSRRARTAALAVLLTAGLIAPVTTSAAAADLPTNISVGTNALSVEISPNGALAYVTNAADRTVSAIDTATRTVTGTISVGTQPEGIGFSPDSRTAYIAHGDLTVATGTVSVIDTATRTVVRTISVAPMGPAEAVVVSPDGKKAYVSGYNYLSVIDTATGVARAISVGNSYGADIAISPDGSRVYIADFYTSKIWVVSTATEQTIAAVQLPTAPTRLAVTPDGLRVYVTSAQANKVYMISTAANAIHATLDVPGRPVGVAAAPNGSRIFLTGYEGNTLVTVNVENNAIVQTRPTGRYPNSVAITPNGLEAYVLQGYYVTVSDATTGGEPGPDRVVRNETLTAGQSRISPDGRYKLLMQGDGNLVLYVVATNQALWASNTYNSGAIRATLQGDGNFVVYAANNVPKWSTNTWGTAADRLIVQNDGNLVLNGPNSTRFWAR